MNHFEYRDGVLYAEDVPVPEIAAAVGRLFDDPELRASLCMRARRDVTARFDVHANVRMLCEGLWPDAGASDDIEKEDVT